MKGSHSHLVLKVPGLADYLFFRPSELHFPPTFRPGPFLIHNMD